MAERKNDDQLSPAAFQQPQPAANQIAPLQAPKSQEQIDEDAAEAERVQKEFRERADAGEPVPRNPTPPPLGFVPPEKTFGQLGFEAPKKK